MNIYIVKDLMVVLQAKLAYWECRKTNSNYTKKACRYRMMLQFLSVLPLDFVIECECASDDNPDEPNAGSLLEIAMHYHYEKDPELMQLAKSGGLMDIRMKNGRGIEIKLSLDGMTYNTRIREPMRIYLANRDGVYIIEKNDIEYIIQTYGKQGHLPYRHCDDPKMRLHKGLTKALGYKVK
jgi:hypothetical protein